VALDSVSASIGGASIGGASVGGASVDGASLGRRVRGGFIRGGCVRGRRSVSVHGLGAVAGPSDRRVGFAHRNLDRFDRRVKLGDFVGDAVRELLDQVEIVGRYEVSDEGVDLFVVHRLIQVVVDGRGLEVQVDRDVHLVPPADPVFLLHHPVVAVEHRIDESDGPDRRSRG